MRLHDIYLVTIILVVGAITFHVHIRESENRMP